MFEIGFFFKKTLESPALRSFLKELAKMKIGLTHISPK